MLTLATLSAALTTNIALISTLQDDSCAILVKGDKNKTAEEFAAGVKNKTISPELVNVDNTDEFNYQVTDAIKQNDDSVIVTVIKTAKNNTDESVEYKIKIPADQFKTQQAKTLDQVIALGEANVTSIADDEAVIELIKAEMDKLNDADKQALQNVIDEAQAKVDAKKAQQAKNLDQVIALGEENVTSIADDEAAIEALKAEMNKLNDADKQALQNVIDEAQAKVDAKKNTELKASNSAQMNDNLTLVGNIYNPQNESNEEKRRQLFDLGRGIDLSIEETMYIQFNNDNDWVKNWLPSDKSYLNNLFESRNKLMKSTKEIEDFLANGETNYPDIDEYNRVGTRLNQEFEEAKTN
ncbi:hypothetical protein [Mycoplasma phocoenae]|uniref:Uncharacterized protein n=1 Tax=Mycoplasma phocoenae TaxID=754517 RepID=A0A858U3Z6_9MOLU|nr:hypothetical protein [Mycoplasma phocoenae]QJG67190.1 hypothetical protein HGG69_02655 [Mycoplasma phocoenae]